jgi:hypothetical protein
VSRSYVGCVAIDRITLNENTIAEIEAGRTRHLCKNHQTSGRSPTS